jgi:hypothetical protein
MTIRRLKTYTGNTGYVYQYYFVGKRPGIAKPDEATTTEYVFDVTSDRKTTYSISIFLSRAVTEAWSVVHGRSLTDAEQYAAVKMRLFQAFDELDDLPNQGRTLVIDSASLNAALQTLGVD